MKTLYLECNMGASGDMLMGALSELTDQEAFVRTMNEAGLPDVSFEAVPSEKCGIYGTHMKVLVNGKEELSLDVHDHMHDHGPHPEEWHHHDHEEYHDHPGHEFCDVHPDHEHEAEHFDHPHDHEHHHHHASMADVEHIIDGLQLPESVKENARAVYHLLAQAESHAHHMPAEEIHFHEVGTMDAIADVTGCCLLFEMIHADRVLCSPIALGSGMVHCAHGILPVPAPATSELIQGMPVYAGMERGELLTPTGAALLRHFVNEFTALPVITIEKTGYGMGNKDFHAANCVRAFLGECEEDGEVVELICNLDDMTPEEIGFAVDRLFEKGALDVYTTPVHMKKNRPGTLFTCMCRIDQREEMIRLMFANLTTLGIREYRSRRYAMHRKVETLHTPYGEVHQKVSSGYGTERKKLEYDDLAAIAEKEGKSLSEVKEELRKAESDCRNTDKGD